MSATRRSRSPVKECFPSLFKALSNPRARLIAFRSSGPNPAASASSRRGSSCFWTLAVRRWASSRGRGSRRPRVWGPWEALGSWSFSRPCQVPLFQITVLWGRGNPAVGARIMRAVLSLAEWVSEEDSGLVAVLPSSRLASSAPPPATACTISRRCASTRCLASFTVHSAA